MNRREQGMHLQRLKTFRTVAALMNFNQAARVLNYAQSSISAQIKTLELEVGTPLFKRSGKKFALTAAGAKLLAYAHKLLAIEEEALAEINGKANAAGLLTLRMPQTIATYYFPAVLREFGRRFPGVNLDISSCAFHSLEQELSIGTVDLAFLLAESVDAADLRFELLKVEPLVLVTRPDHPLARIPRAAYRDLQGQIVLLPKADCGYRMSLEQALVAKNIKPAAVYEMNSIEAIKRAVMTGTGVTVIPEVAVRQELRQKRLVRLDWYEELETGICMIWHKDKWFSRALTGLMDMLRRALAEAS
jgi:DNA-binding transcriptional LysR family regulator